ncbi:MAG TPA: hypothetical protein ENK11_07710 [Phycisphaerales bacterium]|nr:hypothetical protein [Phycisphaerales bacterium]
MRHTGFMFVLALLAATLGGCASSWQRTFEASSAASSPARFEPTEDVVIRGVPWPRLDAALRAIARERAASDTHPNDWTAEQRAEERARLVKALQLSEDPAKVVILGRSVFRTTRDVDPLDGTLSRFARSIGADYAIWSTTALGRTQTVEQEPMTRTGYASRRFRDRDGRLDDDTFWYNETIFVPVVVEREQYAWIVYYVRVLP